MIPYWSGPRESFIPVPIAAPNSHQLNALRRLLSLQKGQLPGGFARQALGFDSGTIWRFLSKRRSLSEARESTNLQPPREPLLFVWSVRIGWQGQPELGSGRIAALCRGDPAGYRNPVTLPTWRRSTSRLTLFWRTAWIHSNAARRAWSRNRRSRASSRRGKQIASALAEMAASEHRLSIA